MAEQRNPMLSAGMARADAEECIREGKPYLPVNPEWLIALIDRAASLEIQLREVPETQHGDHKVKVAGEWAEDRSGGQSPLMRQIEEATKPTGLDWLEKKANRADLP